MLVSRYCVRSNRNTIILKSRTTNNVGSLAIDGYLFRHASQNLHIGAHHNHNGSTIGRNVAFRRVHVSRILAPFIIGSFCFYSGSNGASCIRDHSTIPISSHAPNFNTAAFHSVRTAGYRTTTTCVAKLPRDGIAHLAFRSIRIAFTTSTRPFIPTVTYNIRPVIHRNVVTRGIGILSLRGIDVRNRSNRRLRLRGISGIIHTWTSTPGRSGPTYYSIQ